MQVRGDKIVFPDGTKQTTAYDPSKLPGKDEQAAKDKAQDERIQENADNIALKVEEAPHDGNQYARQNYKWSKVNLPDGGITDAPKDGKTYGRKDEGWAEVSSDAYSKAEMDAQQLAQDTKIDKNTDDIAQNKLDIEKNKTDLETLSDDVDALTGSVIYKGSLNATVTPAPADAVIGDMYINEYNVDEPATNYPVASGWSPVTEVKYDDKLIKTDSGWDKIESVVGVPSYTAGEIDALLDDKADKADVYTKTEIDTQQTAQDTEIAKKADKSDTYTKAETYNTSEIDDKLDDKADTATTYTKIEVDAQQKVQDDKIEDNTTAIDVNTTNIDKKADKEDTYTKDEINSIVADLEDSITAGYKSNTGVTTGRNPEEGKLYLLYGMNMSLKYTEVTRIYISATDGEGFVREFDKVLPDDEIQLVSSNGSGQYKITTVTGMDSNTYYELGVENLVSDGTLSDNEDIEVKLDVAALVVPGIEEAPSDGKQYARQDEAWTEVKDNSLWTDVDGETTSNNNVAVKATLSVDGVTNTNQLFANKLNLQQYYGDDNNYIQTVDSDGVTQMELNCAFGGYKFITDNKHEAFTLGKTGDATFLRDITANGKTVVTEAPEDGKQYARKDATWTEVTGGGSTPTPEALVWEDKTAERALDVEYTNTNDVPIYVTIAHFGTGVTTFIVDGKRLGRAGKAEGGYFTETYVVPSGSKYKLSLYTGTVTLDVWNEARMPLAIAVGGASGGGETTDILPVLLSGTVFEDGVVGTGEDFTCNKTGTGKYTITFNTPRTTLDYSVTALTNTSYVRSISVANKSETKFDIWVRDSSSNDFVDGTFDLTVTGTEPISVGGGSGGNYTPEDMVWENVTADRVTDNTYTNDNDVPLYVQIDTTEGANGANFAFEIDGNRMGKIGTKDSQSSFFVVPPKATYKLIKMVAEGVIENWNEAKMPLAIGTGGSSYTPEEMVWSSDLSPSGLNERQPGTVYTNNNDVPLYIQLYVNSTNSSGNVIAYIDGKLWGRNGVSGAITDFNTPLFIVPSGSTYEFRQENGAVIQRWYEARMPVAVATGGGSYTPETFVWEDKLAERELNTYYTNSTGRPIEVFIIGGEIGTGGDIKFCYKPNGGSEMIGEGLYTNSVAGRQQMTFTVPDGDQYKIAGAGTASLLQWWEVKMPLAVGTGDSIWTEEGDVATYDGDIEVNGVTVGAGIGDIESNTVVGNGAFNSNATGIMSTAIGHNALKDASSSGTNTAVGAYALGACTGSGNTSIGESAGSATLTGSNNTLLGSGAQPSSADVSNEVTIGNGSVTSTRLRGNVVVQEGSVRVESSGNTDIKAVAPSGQYATLQVDNATVKYSMQVRPDEGNSFVIRNETTGQNSMSIATDGKVTFTGIPMGVASAGPNMYMGSDGVLFRLETTYYSTEEVDKKLSIKDKLIEKLSARLDELEKRIK